MVCIIFFVLACNFGAVPSTVSPAPPLTATETPLPSLAQWASGALADSVITGIPVGKPNTLICREFFKTESKVSLDVYFDQPVIPSSANIHMLGELPDEAIFQLLDADGNARDVNFSVEQKVAECPFQYQVTFSDFEEPIAGIRITSTKEFLENWNLVDAVEMTGIPSGSKIDLASTILQPSPTTPPTATLPPTATPTPAPVGERSYRDRTDDYPGKYQLQVVYALFKGDDDRKRDTDGSIARSVTLANDWFKEQTGGSSLRFDTYQGNLDITFVQFDLTAKEALEKYRTPYETYRKEYNLLLEDFYIDYIEDELTRQNFYQKGKYYIFYLERDHPNYCGYSYQSSFPGVFFLGTNNCGYGRLGVDSRAWNTEFVMLHEVLHGIGFTAECAPNNRKDNPSHVYDSSLDLMFAYANANQQQFLDVGNDDYYNHDIEGCPDLADSVFLEPLPDNPQVPKDWPTDYLLDNK